MNIANFWKQKPANRKLEDLYKDTVDSQDFQDFKAMQMKDSRNGKKCCVDRGRITVNRSLNTIQTTNRNKAVNIEKKKKKLVDFDDQSRRNI